MTAVLAGSINMGPEERLNLAVSFVNRLSSGETLSGVATTTLSDETLGHSASDGLVGLPIVTSPLVTQGIWHLKSGHRYLLDISIGTSQGQTLQGEISITCEGKPHQL